jgi:hypothetical protein
MAALSHRTSLRAAIPELSGNRTPWVDPGWGAVALLVAAAMVIGALRRDTRREGTGG